MAITLDGTVGITTADIAATTLTVNAGFGSNATAYGVRAWVNFNGTGTVAIRDSGNVSSITDNGTGNYTANFTTNMPDTNYSVGGVVGTGAVFLGLFTVAATPSTSSVTIQCENSGSTNYDFAYTNVQIIR